MKIILSQKEMIALKPRKEPREYVILRYLASHYNNTLIIDAGTRNGASALALSSNLTNTVHSYDIIAKWHTSELEQRSNVTFFTKDCNELDDEAFKGVSIIYLDISHNGTDEEKFLKKLDAHFKGILVMDDVSCPKRWPKLHKLWNDIARPKILVPERISANRGTGIIMYGDQVELTD